MPWAGDMPDRQGGAMMADRTGRHHRPTRSTTCSSRRASSCTRGAVYEGMIVGENSRPDDMMVNVRA
jgi:GTP-binding protein